ncbi:ABC transporter permease subunit [Streptomyces fuscichromogenes]|uniref:ABC transporter permease n=1 Tax=Streptomyces fuscichromogenes TaxID=1324013 RepID=A0A917XGG1_9ACTN|nr:ABC transporter permease subunit [Streptomyces fuscichromogenes]GGN22339.1 ABC transporter permease [Streptomyces fuscichromogenes]
MNPLGSTRLADTANGAWHVTFTHTLHAEWTKLRTAGDTGRLLLLTITLTVAVGCGTAKAVKCPDTGCGQDPVKLALTGITVGQAVIAVLAVLAISNEYGTGMIRTTLTAVPNRLTVLAAKATVLTTVVLASGTAAVLASLLAGRCVLPGNGFTAAHGYAPLTLADGPTLRAAAGSVLYLALIALLALGTATAVRDAASAIATVLGLLYLFPILTQVVNNPHWQHRLQQISPMTAGLAVQATVHLRERPIGPWAGLGVLATWAATALMTGSLLLHARDT